MIDSVQRGQVIALRMKGVSILKICRRVGLSRHKTHMICREVDEALRSGTPIQGIGHAKNICKVCGDGHANSVTGLCQWCSEPLDEAANDEPTEAPPGSVEKIEVLARRFAAKINLWNPEDIKEHAPKAKGDREGIGPRPVGRPRKFRATGTH